jgi:predicted metal-binding membrane protein
MALFAVVGVMNVGAMVVLAAVVLTEKLWVHGEVVARVAGAAALVAAVAVVWVPALAPGLPGVPAMGM